MLLRLPQGANEQQHEWDSHHSYTSSGSRREQPAVRRLIAIGHYLHREFPVCARERRSAQITAPATITQ
jgi:hypothetical protein